VKIALFLRRLDIGGTERQFLQLAAGLREAGEDVLFVTQLPGGELADSLDRDVRRTSLFPERDSRMHAALRLVATPGRLRRLLREERPDVLYSALYLSNAHALRATRRERIPLVWGFRGTSMPRGRIRQLAFSYCRRHAPEPQAAIFNSSAGLAFHEDSGFRLRTTHVIPNGIDTQHYRPDPALGAAYREEHGIPSDAFLVGTVGRLAPVKDNEGFLRAAALLHARVPAARFLLVGDGEPSRVASLRDAARAHGIEDRVVFAGASDDPRPAYAALDLYASTSRSEGFSNAIGEAMACGLPSVVTDVGDSAWLVGDAGTLVPRSDPEAWAAAWGELARREPAERRAIGERARARVESEFTPRVCVRATLAALAAARDARQ